MVEFGDLRPMLAQRLRSPFNSPDHMFEVKWDGYRALAYVTPRGVRYQSRQGKDLSESFPSLSRCPVGFPAHGAVVDGEIVSMVGQRSSFHHLRQGRGHLVYVAFDLLLAGDGLSLMDRPWHERRRHLEDGWVESPAWSLSPVVAEQGEWLWQIITQQGLEGMVAKTKSGPYLAGQRSGHWVKVSHRKTLDCVIVSVLVAGSGRISSVGVAVYDAKRLHYLGQVGSGLSQQTLRRIRDQLKTTPEAMVSNPPDDALLWTVPTLVCTVEYLEITPRGRLRHPVFCRLRPELSPSDCHWPKGGTWDKDKVSGQDRPAQLPPDQCP